MLCTGAHVESDNTNYRTCTDSDGMNGIKYAAYRTAMKLRAIQKITHCKSKLIIISL